MPTEDMRTIVAYAAIGDCPIDAPIYPKQRYEQIISCKSEKTRREKYFVWQLLKKTVEDHLNLCFDNLIFTKQPNGQWVCPDFYFSLSHTDGVACVAVSRDPIGVDVELIRPIKMGIAERFLTDREMEAYLELPEDRRDRFLIEAWVKKEADFKMRGGDALMPRCNENIDSKARLASFELCGSEYLLAVSGNENTEIEILYTEEI